MSILQEYEEIKNQIGLGKYNAIHIYLKEICSQEAVNKLFDEYKNVSYENDDWSNKLKDIKCKNNIILLDDILYNDKQWNKFEKWFKNYLNPFRIMKNNKNVYSVFLDQNDYYYDWVQEKKVKFSNFGDGHCYDALFNDYLEDNFSNLNSRLNYDSENGMFCVYCKSKHDAEQVCFELSKLYKDEIKMIQLIKETKQKYNYIFDTNISI